MQIYGGIFAMQLYWNHTSAWVISSKFVAFLQNTFSEKHLWGTASGNLHYNKKHTVSCLLFLSTVVINQFHSYTKILTPISFIPTPSSLHSTLIPCIPTPIPIIPTLIPRIPTLIPIIPTQIPRIPTLIPHIPIIPLIPFPDSPFRLLQIAYLS